VEATDLVKAIQGEIEKHITGVQAEVFRNFVAEAQANRAELATCKIKITRLEEEAVRSSAKISRLERLEDQESRLNSKEKELTTKELELKHEKEITGIKLQAEVEKTSLVRGMFQDVFRNSEIRHERIGKMPVLVEQNYTNGDKFHHIEDRDTYITETTKKE
jgi:hypothetical protein